MKFLLVGCGSIGRRHARNLLSLGHSVHVHDPDPEAQHWAAEHGMTIVPDLSPNGVDAALICTPSTHRLDVLVRLPGLPVFIEKPLALTIGEAYLIVALCASSRVFVGQCYRFHPALLEFRESLQRAGRIYYIQIQCGHHLSCWHKDYATRYHAHEETGGGVLWDIGGHVFDSISFVLNKAEIRVATAWAQNLGVLGIAAPELAWGTAITGKLPIMWHFDYLSSVKIDLWRALTETGPICADLTNLTQIEQMYRAEMEAFVAFAQGGWETEWPDIMAGLAVVQSITDALNRVRA